jgi:hypothetical protein
MQIGQHVKLINDSGWDSGRALVTADRGVVFPVRGIVYTVREILEWYTGELGWHACIKLMEITNPLIIYRVMGESEQAFRISRFKPLQKWDVSEFRKEFVTLDA